jgi:S-(hydroxymethyl)glutathione dehydrogenase / alcohol dehydrogenase
VKTLAAVLVEPGRPLELMELQIPSLKSGQVLVEVAYSGVCHTQVLEVRGLRGRDPWCPHCLGHEAVGTVLEIGPGVRKARAGDSVVLTWIEGNGANGGGVLYSNERGTINAGPVATFAHRCIVSENRLVPLPSGIEPRLGVLLGCAAPTGMGSVINVARAEEGRSVAVIGAGGVGSCAIVAAAYQKCRPIVAVDKLDSKLAIAKSLGATHAINSTSADPTASISEIIPGGPDIVIEATGRPEVMAFSLTIARHRGGTVVIIGNAPHGSELALDPALFNQGKRLLGTWGGDTQPDRDVPLYAKILAGSKVGESGIFGESYELADINRALSDLAQGGVGRPIIAMDAH